MYSASVSLNVTSDGFGVLPANTSIPNIEIKESSAITVSAPSANSSNPLLDPFVIASAAVVLTLITLTSVFSILRLKKREKTRELSISQMDFEHQRQAVLQLINEAQSLRTLIVVDSNSGLPVYSHSFKQLNTDEVLISGFLQAISSFGRQIAGDSEVIREVSYRDFSITSFAEKQYTFYLISDMKLGTRIKDGFEEFSYWFANTFDFEGLPPGEDLFNQQQDAIMRHLAADIFAWVSCPITIGTTNIVTQNPTQDAVINYLEVHGDTLFAHLLQELSTEFEPSLVFLATANLVDRSIIIPVPSQGSGPGVLPEE